MADKKISDATAKASLANTDMLPLAAAGDTTAYKITGEALISSLPAASTSAKGTIELATEAEAQTGTDAERAVTPAGLLVRKTGTAILAGDLTGNARGATAVDLQATRSAVTQVANGDNTTAIGQNNTASGAGGVAVGLTNTASGANSLAAGYNNTASGAGGPAAVGYDNLASGDNSAALGYDNTASATGAAAAGVSCVASAAGAAALGKGAIARIEKTVNICGPQIIRKDNGEDANSAFESFCGAHMVFMTKEVNFKTVANNVITLPAGCHFYPLELFVIVTAVSGFSAGPTVRFGYTGDREEFLPATLVTEINAAYKFYVYDGAPGVVPGRTTLTADITIGATATSMTGRLGLGGLLIEDE